LPNYPAQLEISVQQKVQHFRPSSVNFTRQQAWK